MKKILFTFIVLLLASPAFANDRPYRDMPYNEQPPAIEQTRSSEYGHSRHHESWWDKLRRWFFRHDKNNRAREREAVNPSKAGR
ncbi:MAG: hypothetical protein LUG16_02315 [Candidatus Gastranaerophilales bacterium]|nr:hypothetical protein [Candidatus Gastranaerophilales bacterium]